jgi:hypothetical protein
MAQGFYEGNSAANRKRCSVTLIAGG